MLKMAGKEKPAIPLPDFFRTGDDQHPVHAKRFLYNEPAQLWKSNPRAEQHDTITADELSRK